MGYLTGHWLGRQVGKVRIPVQMLRKEDVETLQERCGGSLRRVVSRKHGESLVLSRSEWGILKNMFESAPGSLNESSALLIRAYNQLIQISGGLTTPAGKAAAVAAVVSLYNADPGLASRLAYILGR